MAADDILDEAEQRWQRTADQRPELAAAVDLQRVLVTRSTELAAETARIARGATAARPDLLARLRRGEAPVLNLAVEIDADRVLPFLLGFCSDFAAGGAGEPARRVRAAIEGREIDPGSLLRASLARQQEAIRMRAHHLGLAPDLVWLVAELAVGPVANRLQHDALAAASVPRAARDAMRAWRHGHCPACASWPALAESRDAERHLRCSFCGADWTPPDVACVYCNRAGDAFLTASAAPDRPARRIEFCRACGAYLKHVDAPAATPFLMLPVLDLETSDLDLLAVERGYARPPMRQIATADVLCPPETVR